QYGSELQVVDEVKKELRQDKNIDSDFGISVKDKSNLPNVTGKHFKKLIIFHRAARKNKSDKDCHTAQLAGNLEVRCCHGVLVQFKFQSAVHNFEVDTAALLRQAISVRYSEYRLSGSGGDDVVEFAAFSPSNVNDVTGSGFATGAEFSDHVFLGTFRFPVIPCLKGVVDIVFTDYTHDEISARSFIRPLHILNKVEHNRGTNLVRERLRGENRRPTQQRDHEK